MKAAPSGEFVDPVCGMSVASATAAGKHDFDGETYIFEPAITADFALVRALRGDRWGNLVYRKTARNFGPIMAAAAKTTIVQVDDIVELGALDPESIVTPGLYVDRVVAVGERAWLRDGEFIGSRSTEGAAT